MGGKLTLPEPDDRIRKNIVIARLTTYELAYFWSHFKRLDKDKTGFVHLSVMCKKMEYSRTLFSDCLLELLDINNEDGRITFSEFLDIIVTYCLFEPFHILKYCFFVFDQDKDGYFQADELRLLMNVLHNIKHPDKVKGTVKNSWMNLEIAYDDRVEFEEFEKFHKQFPQLFEPAFQLQIKMTRAFMGGSWWASRKRKLQDIKDTKKAKEARKLAKIEKRRQEVRNNKLRKRMGCLYFYFCPCLRGYYMSRLEPEPVEEPEDERKKRQEAIAAAKRKTDCDVKNQETVEWQKFEKKIKPEIGGSEQYIEKKLEKVQRNRVSRVETRKDRKNQRLKAIDDGFDKKRGDDDD
eukprot:gene3364-6658_t